MPQFSTREGVRCAWRVFSSMEASPANLVQLAVFLDSIPEHVNRLLKPIEYRKEEITRFVCTFPKMADLLRDAAILVILLCDERTELRIPLLKVKNVLSGPRRGICKALGGFGTKSELYFLLKIRFEALDEKAVILARKILGNKPVLDAIQLLHLQYADNRLVELLIKYPAAFTCPALRKQVEQLYGTPRVPDELDSFCFSKIRSFADTIDDIFRMSEHGDFPDAAKQIASFTSVVAVTRLHDRMCEAQEVAHLLADPLFKNDLGPPPLKGTETIIPIRTFKDLDEESREMHHCILSYCRAVWEKRYYAYRVMAPERATVGIEIGKDGKLEIVELKLVCNAEPSEETRLEVWEWFRRQN
jgi:PcfJ-like protein